MSFLTYSNHPAVELIHSPSFEQTVCIVYYSQFNIVAKLSPTNQFTKNFFVTINHSLLDWKRLCAQIDHVPAAKVGKACCC